MLGLCPRCVARRRGKVRTGNLAICAADTDLLFFGLVSVFADDINLQA